MDTYSSFFDNGRKGVNYKQKEEPIVWEKKQTLSYFSPMFVPLLVSKVLSHSKEAWGRCVSLPLLWHSHTMKDRNATGLNHCGWELSISAGRPGCQGPCKQACPKKEDLEEREKRAGTSLPVVLDYKAWLLRLLSVWEHPAKQPEQVFHLINGTLPLITAAGEAAEDVHIWDKCDLSSSQ